MDKNIFLIGMPSSGKSTLGKNLAKLLNYDFVDLDNRIITAEGLTVNEIFKLKGEEYFRQAESNQLKKVGAESRVVVATGGGTPCFFDNLEYIKTNGVSIFLNVPPERIAERMKHAKAKERPMFNHNQTDLLESLTAVYNKRLEQYTQADLVIEGDTNAESIVWLLEYNVGK